jgi:hypothetical protein
MMMSAVLTAAPVPGIGEAETTAMLVFRRWPTGYPQC